MGSAVAGALPHLREPAEAGRHRDPRDRLTQAPRTRRFTRPPDIEAVPAMSLSSNDKRRQNRKLGLILASVAVVFFLGFFAKVMLLGK